MTSKSLFLFGFVAALFLGGCASPSVRAPDEPAPALATPTGTVEQWGTFEASFKGPTNGNPFDLDFSATFTNGKTAVTANGFYDGDGTYRVRCMPTVQGDWTFVTKSSAPALSGKSGKFTVSKPSPSNHGPVRVARTTHFDYADGSPYFELGTTCYTWTYEQDASEEQTLATLKDSPFNKIRMCVLPTRLPERRPLYPFVSTGAAGRFDTTRLNPEFFQHYETRVGQLRDLGIEADLIIYHPYESRQAGFGNTTFNGMNQAGDERYLRYLVARLGAYRNVWWSMANEYDALRAKEDANGGDSYWDHLFQYVHGQDPYGHLLSIHMQNRMYNYTQPWVTHASIQNGSAVEDFGRAILYRDVYAKPIVFDEVKYEGDPIKFAARWGRLTGQEMVEDFWHAWIDGTYCGHSETFADDQNNWLSKGGKLLGESPPRLAFLKKIMEAGPPEGIDPVDKWQDVHTAGPVGQKSGYYYIVYFGKEAPKEWAFDLPSKMSGGNVQAGWSYKVEIIDTWNMTITPVDKLFVTEGNADKGQRYRMHAQGNAKVTLPGTPDIALRITFVR